MKSLILLLALGCGGCFYLNPYEGGRGRDYIEYKVLVSSDDARDITIYLPFPHYKGKPDMKILQWMRETLDKYYLKADPSWYRKEYEESWKVARNIKLDLIDTEYGKMLYIYIPKLSPAERIFGQVHLSTGDQFDRPSRINRKRVFKDYRLTYEDKAEIEKEWEEPYAFLKNLKMPIYVQFEGKGLNVGMLYRIFVTAGESIGGYFHYRFGNAYEVDKNLNFTKPGWHWIPIEKRLSKIQIKEYGGER